MTTEVELTDLEDDEPGVPTAPLPVGPAPATNRQPTAEMPPREATQVDTTPPSIPTASPSARQTHSSSATNANTSPKTQSSARTLTTEAPPPYPGPPANYTGPLAPPGASHHPPPSHYPNTNALPLSSDHTHRHRSVSVPTSGSHRSGYPPVSQQPHPVVMFYRNSGDSEVCFLPGQVVGDGGEGASYQIRQAPRAPGSSTAYAGVVTSRLSRSLQNADREAAGNRQASADSVMLSYVMLVCCTLQFNIPAVLCAISALACATKAQDFTERGRDQTAKSCLKLSLLCNTCALLEYILLLIGGCTTFVLLYVVF